MLNKQLTKFLGMHQSILTSLHKQLPDPRKGCTPQKRSTRCINPPPSQL